MTDAVYAGIAFLLMFAGAIAGVMKWVSNTIEAKARAERLLSDRFYTNNNDFTRLEERMSHVESEVKDCNKKLDIVLERLP